MDLKRAIQKTKKYAEYFYFPLTPRETHYWLISKHVVPFSKISPFLKKLTPSEIKLKRNLNITTRKKIQKALRLVHLLNLFPQILFVGLTGSVAANNSHKNDDLDIMIITAPHTLWITRPFFLVCLSIFYNRRHPQDSNSKMCDTFCPNLWLDTHALVISQKTRNIYTAHEVLQVKPIFDRGDYFQEFLRKNRWVSHYLANAFNGIVIKYPHKNIIPPLFFLAPLNIIFFILQYLYMLPKKTSEKVTLHSAFFHKKDPSHNLVKRLSSLK